MHDATCLLFETREMGWKILSTCSSDVIIQPQTVNRMNLCAFYPKFISYQGIL